jgi:hypothetical protein
MGIINPANTYNYGNSQVRDVNEAFTALVAQKPYLLSVIGQGAVATNHKCEWQEDQFTPTQTTIASFGTGSTGGDATVINVVSATGIEVGTVLRFTTSTGASRDEVVIVTAVNTNALTVTRQYGSSAASTFAVGDKVYRLAKPLGENSTAGSGAGRAPSQNYNYTQIFDAIAEVSRTSIQTQMYGLDSAYNYAVVAKMAEIAYDLNNAIIYGRRVQRTADTVGAKGSMGGILQYLSGGNVDTTGGAVSATIINNVVEAVFQDGAEANSLAIVCNSNQARKLSALDGSYLQVMRTDAVTGHKVGTFSADFMPGGEHQIVIDPIFPKDQIAVINPSLVNIRTMQPMIDIDATANGQDGKKGRLLTELTLEVKNGQTAHGLAKGLNV